MLWHAGDISLRIARSLRDLTIKNLKHIFAISPVVDPWAAAPLVDVNPIYRRYFLKKWTASLRKKQAIYPDIYNLKTCPVPISIITAADDGIIPPDDIHKLELNYNARRIIHKNGGHNGFFQSLTGPTWYDDYVSDIIFE